MLLQVILEGIGLGVLLILVCAIGIRKGAVGMVHLYSPEVQERCVTLGLTTHAKIKRNALIFKAVCVPGYPRQINDCIVKKQSCLIPLSFEHILKVDIAILIF